MSKWANQPRALTMTYLQIGAIVIATIVVAALVPAANGFRSIELNNGGGRKLFGGYRITPKHCRATKTLPMSDPRSTGPTICMFNHECAQRNGEVVGACMDGFLFGACCQIPLTQELESTLITDAQNTYYQQHQQQKLQLQQAVSNPAAAQSYESYGESIQSQEIKYPEVSSASQEQHMTNGYGQRPAAAVSSSAQEQLYQQENIDKVYQQLGSSTSGYVEQSQSAQADMQHHQHQEQQHQHTQQQQMQQQQHHIAHDEIVDQQQEAQSSDQEADKSNATGDQQTSNLDSQQSASNELEVNSQLHTESQAGASNTIADNPPPQFHVNKGSVKISSPSSPPQNDDFVMQVLSTLSPDLANDQITFTTEVPMKISNSLTEQTSSESNSFEEMPSATQMTPVKSSMVKPTASPGMQHKDDASEVQSEETQQSQSAELEVQSAEKQSSTLKPTKQQLQQEQHKQQQEQLQQQQQQLQQQQQQQHQQQQQQLQQQQLHLQQQQHQQHQQQQEQLHQHQQQQILQQQHQEQHQEQHQHNHNHLILSGGEFTHSDITHPGADADLVEDDLQFSTGYGPQPVYVEAPSKAANVPSTTVKIPSANQEYGSSNNNSPTTSSSITTHVDSIESIILQLNNSNQGPAYTVVKQQTPSYSTSDDSSSNSYEATAAPSAANPTAAPTNIYHDDVETKRPMDVPAYLETVTTKLNLESQSSSMMENVYPSPKPTPGASDSDASYDTLEDHTMPEKNYIDTSSSSHQTSDFNKMPQGVAYPVDMSYMEEEGNLLMDENEQQGYGGLVPTSQRPVEMTTTTSSQKTPEEGEMQSRPIVSYIGVVTSQTFNKKQPAPAYNQLPQEVTVSSHSTKVQEQYDTSSPSYQQNQPQYAEKLTTVSYVESPTTATQSDRIATTTPTYVPSSTILTSLPHYVASTYDATTSTTRPVLVTAAGTQKPRPRPKPSTKRPASIQRVTKPPSNKKPAKPISTYIQEAQETNYQQQSVNQQSGYDQIVKKPASQPSPVYHDDVEIETKKPATTKPSKRPSTHSTHVKTKKPSATTTTTKHQYQTTPSYNSEVSNTQQQDYPARPIIQENTSTKYETGSSASVTYNQDPYTPSASSANRRPVSNDMAQSKPISTSYVTGPTSPRPSSTFSYQDGNGPSIIINDDKLNAFVLSTAQSVVSMSQTPASYPSTYQSASYGGSVTPSYQEQKPYTNYKKPGFVKVQPQSTQKPPLPTVLITPKPTVINLVTASSWANTNKVDGSYGPTTPIPGFSSTSYVYSPMVTRRPDFAMNTPEYVNVPAMSSNDFDDPGYYGGQGQHVPAPSFTNAPTDATYAVPSDDRPAFPGYYGPTPTYPAFHVPGEKVGSQLQQDEETFTSPNDFVNFPPVRNPNLNMSATSSSVTTDIEMSTPAFVEDGVLKDKMNTLVHKIVESLQGNFDALADLIDEGDTKNGSAPIATYHSPSATASSAASTAGTTTRKPTRKATQRVTTARPKPKPTTRKPVTRVSTKAPTKRVTVTTRKPATRRPTTTTRKPTRRVTSTTTQKPLEDEIVDEEDEEDVNPSANEVDQDETLSGAGGRKFKCGVRPHIKSGRIVGGKGSTFGAYPWQVLVRESTWLGLFTKNKCGGVLITSRYVITAAHCQPGFLASLVAVMGEFDISGDLESKRAVTKNVKRVIVHRQYDPATFENDLALLELDSPVQFDTHIVPICMPSDVADFTGRMATVTGWGRLKYGGGVPSVLQEVQVPVIENSVCQEMFHTAGHNKKILNSFLCAGYANGQKDSCEGDSGGPLVLQRPDGRYELAGTVSHGIKCAAPYLPGVYMRTTFYKPWLRSITGVK